MKVSVIITYYKNEKDILECLSSFYEFKPKFEFEIIVVDNSDDKSIKNKLKPYKEVVYLNSPENIGYGKGINLGVNNARGEYLFVLNQDTVFTEDILTKLLVIAKNTSHFGIVAPLLYSVKNEVMQQGAKILTPLRALVKLSFIDKLFPNNPISKQYIVSKWGKNITEVDVVPGTAFLIKKDMFKEMGGFDKHFFLYFEEFDLCKRIKEKGYKIYIDPNSKLIHKWGTSTKNLNNIDLIFRKSRFYYFKKHYGILKALIIELFLSLNSKTLILSGLIFSALFIRLYNFSQSLNLFLGDQGWFYLSARDILLNGQIPLVGITSSHLWLHQGPLWTYILAFLFFIFKFNPLTPIVFTVCFDTLTLIVLYIVIKNMFSLKTALIASLIYAFSPYVIIASRMPYHTSLIPGFCILTIFCIYKWLKGDVKYFPLLIGVVSVLYNFELQTSLLFILIFLFLVFGFFKKTIWYKKLLTRKIIIYSIICFLIPMLPILVYDFKNGFPQTFVFAGWIIYKLISSVINVVTGSGSAGTEGYLALGNYFYTFFQKLIFIQNGLFSLLLIVASFIYLLVKVVLDYFKKKLKLEYLLILIFNIWIFIGIVISKTPSEAYLCSLMIPVLIMLSLFLTRIAINKYAYVFIVLILLLFSYLNIQHLVNTIYFKNNVNTQYLGKVETAKYMVNNANGHVFRIVGKGPGSEFRSFTMGYEYLAWYYGGKIRDNAKLTYILNETLYGTKIIIRD